MQKKYWIILGTVVAILLFSGGFIARKGMEEPKIYVEPYDYNKLDSIGNILNMKYDSLLYTIDSLTSIVKIKQDANKKTYDDINNTHVIYRDDSLLESIIRLTNDGHN